MMLDWLRGKRSHSHIPCLTGLPEPQQRALYKEAYREVRWPLAVSIGAFSTAVSVIILFSLAGAMFGSRWNPGVPWGVIATLLGVPGLVGIHLLERWFDRHIIAPRIWRRLPQVCSVCGYDLRGNASGRCPECGRLQA